MDLVGEFPIEMVHHRACKGGVEGLGLVLALGLGFRAAPITAESNMTGTIPGSTEPYGDGNSEGRDEEVWGQERLKRRISSKNSSHM